VLALGAQPRHLPLEGGAAHEVVHVNSLDDYASFRARLESARSVAILGAGLVGCEFANDLAGAGYPVHVVELATQALPRLLDADGVRPLVTKLEALGVRFWFGARARRVERIDSRLQVTLDSAVIVAADLVLGATGLVPNVALAQACGLEVGSGIKVDACLRTSDEDIFAIGDCAELDGRVLPFTEPIRHGARALGATLAGVETPVEYPGMRVDVKTPAHPLSVELGARVPA
jgi:rubredoxin-NAD+ reductase